MDHSEDSNIDLDQATSELAYYNADIAPTKLAERTWTTKDFAVLWISMSACIPTYQLASGLISQGMDWLQAVVTILSAISLC